MSKALKSMHNTLSQKKANVQSIFWSCKETTWLIIGWIHDLIMSATATSVWPSTKTLMTLEFLLDIC